MYILRSRVQITSYRTFIQRYVAGGPPLNTHNTQAIAQFVSVVYKVRLLEFMVLRRCCCHAYCYRNRRVCNAIDIVGCCGGAHIIAVQKMYRIFRHQQLFNINLKHSILCSVVLYTPYSTQDIHTPHAHLYPPRNEQTSATMHKARTMSPRWNMTGPRVLVQVLQIDTAGRRSENGGRGTCTLQLTSQLLACVTSVGTYTQYGVYRVVIVHIMAIVDQFELRSTGCYLDSLFHVPS